MFARPLAVFTSAAMLLLAACVTDSTPPPSSNTTTQTAACTAANGTCVSEDRSGCTGKAYPYCLPPTGATYCSWAFRGRVLPDVACVGKASCCFVDDAGTSDAGAVDGALLADASTD